MKGIDQRYTGKYLVKKQNSCFVMSLLIFLVSCSHPVNISPQLSDPEVVMAQGYVVPRSKIIDPDTIPAGRPIKVTISKKDEIPGKLISQLAGNPEKLKMANPVIKIPGENGTGIPEIRKAKINPVLCKAPVVVPVKDAHSKEINPQNFSNFSKLQGLRSDQVRSMVQDANGNLWLGTDDGLTRYDGKYFYRYTTEQGLKNNLILWVYIDSHENIWFGSYGGGVTMYDGRYLLHFTTEEGLVDNYVNCVYEDSSENIWIGTIGGISIYNGITFTNYTTEEGLCGNFVRGFVQDKLGRIWIASDDSGLSIFDGSSFNNYSENEGLINNSINFLFLDNNKDIWLGAGSTNLLKYDGVNFLLYALEGGSGNNFIRTITLDDSGNMWIGTEEEGLLMFNGRTFTRYTEKEGLSSNLIRCSLKDKNGKLWFGTRGGGLTRYDGDLFTHMNRDVGLSNNRVMAILEDKPDEFWIGTYGGYVTRSTYRVVDGLKRRYFSYYDEKDGLLNGRVYTILKDLHGNIWFGTDGGGVSVFDGKVMTTYTASQGLCGNAVRKIIQDREGNIWIATHNSGISKFDGKNFINYTTKQGICSDYVLCMMEDTAGNIWIGTTNAGITKYDGKNFTHYNENNGFYNDMVYSILQDKNGIIWFGTGGAGVISFDGKLFTIYTNIKDQEFQQVLSSFQDSRNNIWFGTRNGPVILKEGRIENPEFKSYSYEDGFTGIGCNLAAITESADGTIWIGATDRLSAFHPKGVKTDSIPPHLELTGIQIYNENIPWTEFIGKEDSIVTLHNGVNVGRFRFDSVMKWNGIPEKLSLRYNTNYLTFSYSAVSVLKNNKLRYQYKLDGVDENWCIPTVRTEVSYGNLNQGSHIFRVRAINSEGLMSNEIAYRFTIRPPWYKTVWFMSLVTMIIVFVIYSFIRYRVRKLENDKMILQKKVDEQTAEILQKNIALTEQKNEILIKNVAIEKTNLELTETNSEKDKFFSILAHDLRGPFGAILGLTQEMVDELPNLNRDEIGEIVKMIQSSATSLFRLLENLLNWARMKQGQIPFNQENIQLSELVNECALYFKDQANAKQIEIASVVPSELVVSADKNMLQSVLRNLISNAVKFTYPGGKISIIASRSRNEMIEISVKDNGMGMSQDLLQKMFRIDEKINRSGTEGEISTGLGLLICKEFIEKHNGRIWVESEEGKGSIFSFLIPEQSV